MNSLTMQTNKHKLKILIITERFQSGGTEIQTQREKKALEEKGLNVYLLTFDPKFEYEVDINNKSRWMNIPVQFNVPQTFINHVFGSPKYRKIIRSIVLAIKPDFIHINNVFALPDDVYAVVKNFPVLQTIRDYMAICPTGECIDKNGNRCDGYAFGKCYSCVRFKPRYIAKRLLMRRLNSRRMNAVNRIVSPSQALADACSRNGLLVNCLNNPFDFSILKKIIPNYASNIYMYYGKIAKIKGVAEIIRAFEIFHEKHKDKKLWIVGTVDDSYDSTFKSMLNDRNSSYIEYKGVMSNSQIMEIYSEVFCVCVPSLWIENYPNTVLEALANKTLVIGSNRGGIPELIQNEMFLFNVLDQDDIVAKLEYTAWISEEEYNWVVNTAYDRICTNNSIESYIEKLEQIISETIENTGG